MPTIVFASSKGGTGKTTSSFILATELANKDFNVTIIDADPNKLIAKWAKNGGEAKHLTIIESERENKLVDEISNAEDKSDFVIVDLEGSANMSVGYAVALADLVIIPSQRSILDSTEAAKVINLVKAQSKVVKRNIPIALLLTRTSPAIRSKGLKRMLDSLDSHQIETFTTEINEREAFKAIFDFSTTLYKLKPSQVSGIEKAKENAHNFAAETLQKISTFHNKGREVA